MEKIAQTQPNVAIFQHFRSIFIFSKVLEVFIWSSGHSQCEDRTKMLENGLNFSRSQIKKQMASLGNKARVKLLLPESNAAGALS